MRTLLLAGAAAMTLAACNSSGTGSGTGGTTPGSGLSSLINVNISDIRAEVAKNVNVALEDVPITVQLPVTAAANVCGVDVNLLSVQINTGNNTCTAKVSSPAIEQEVRNQIG